MTVAVQKKKKNSLIPRNRVLRNVFFSSMSMAKLGEEPVELQHQKLPEDIALLHLAGQTSLR
jgi:hypothetical protein